LKCAILWTFNWCHERCTLLKL